MFNICRALFVTVLLCCLSLPLAVGAEVTGKLRIFHAGSLTVPFAAMEKEFEASYPGVDIQREHGGSTRMARLISFRSSTRAFCLNSVSAIFVLPPMNWC
ncbi:MAG: hypothetical protein BA869_03915 [Desulfuromonadales bacterium C00003107]|nr:MAG: hypothetical protein BA869_03915 [Desulfuromonadales bacterium C00003107]